MGSFNRDYMQDDYESSNGPSWGHDVPTTKWLIVVTIGIYCLQVLFQSGGRSAIDVWFPLSASGVKSGQVWRLVTYVFCHPIMNPLAITFNMLGVWFCGAAIERMYGSRETLWFYLTSAVYTALVFLAFGFKFPLEGSVIGAGPAVGALLALFVSHSPKQEFLFLGIVPLAAWMILLIFVIQDLFMIINASTGLIGWGVLPYLTTLWGCSYGFLYRKLGIRFSSIGEYFDVGNLRRWFRRTMTSRKLKVYSPESTGNLDEQVDAILAKIHENGSESLTARERAILQQASERAKHRP